MNRLAVAAIIGACACSPTDPTSDDHHDAGPTCQLVCGDLDASFDFDGPLAPQVRGVIDQTCSNIDGCHGSGAGNMPLSVGMEFDAMIDVVSYEMPPMLRVKPGDPSNSYVYLKLRCQGGIDGGCMPGGQPNPSIARLFHDWIEAGAPTP